MYWKHLAFYNLRNQKRLIYSVFNIDYIDALMEIVTCRAHLILLLWSYKMSMGIYHIN